MVIEKRPHLKQAATVDPARVQPRRLEAGP
jgi:hypothetical protein